MWHFSIFTDLVRKTRRFSKLNVDNPQEHQGTLKRRSPSPEYSGPPAKKVASPTQIPSVLILEQALLAVHAKVLQLSSG